MSKKSLYKVLSLILVVALVLPVLPARITKAAENPDYNQTGDSSTVSPAAITMMATAETSTTLNIMDGPITVTNQTYVQKNSSGTIVSQGDITDELVLTGSQANLWPLTLEGSNLPTIRFKSVNSNGYVKGTATGVLNIILEGNCTFTNFINATYSEALLPNLTTIDITGEDGNRIDGLQLSCSTTLNNLNLNNLNYVSASRWAIDAPRNFNMLKCTVTNGYADITTAYNATTKAATNYSGVIQDSNLSALNLIAFTNFLIDNTIVGGASQYYSLVGNAYNASFQPDSFTIQNSIITASGYDFATPTNKIINSRLEATGTVNHNKINSAFYSAGTTLVKGSTLIGAASASYDYFMNYTNNLVVDDSSFNFFGTPSTTKRFYYSTSRVDPHDTSNNLLFLNKVKVPGVTSSSVSVSIDDRTAVNLWTDSSDYLHLFLPVGDHTVVVTDINGNQYYKTFTAINTRETSTDSNIVGELEPAKASTNISTPYINTSLQYSFDNSNWSNATTDGTGVFKAVIPDNVTRIYIKLTSGEIKHAIISDGVVGNFYADKPIISEQSNSDVTFLKEMQGTVYVNSVPYTIGDTLTYQWYKDGVILPGKTSPVLNLSATNVSDAGTYTCIIKESDGRTITSSPITVIINEGQPEEEGELSIISQSLNKTLIKGYSTELYINAKPSLSTKELTYQWYKDGEEIPGATDSKLNLNSVVPEDTGSYVCRVYEDSKYLDSDPILVTVENNPLEDDITDLNNQVSDLISQVGSLTDQLNTANQDKETLQDTINGLESQMESYTKQISDLQGDITELVQELQDANGDKEALNQTITDLNNQITGLNNQILTLQADLEAANEDKETLEETVAGLQIDIINLNGQINLLQGKLSDSEEANDELSDQVTELHNTISGLETEVTNLQSDLDSLSEQNSQLLSQVELLTSQKTELENEIQRLQDLLDDANDTIDDLTQQVNNLTTEVNTLTEQLGTANGEKAALQDTIIGLEDQITNLNNQIYGLNEHVSELEEALQQEEAEHDTLNQTIIDLNSQITILNQTVSSLQTQLTSVTEERNTLQDTVTGLNTQITDLNNQITVLIGRLEDSEEENTELKNQVTELHNTVTGLETDITNLHNDLDILHETNTNLQGQLDTANNTVSSLNALLVLIKGELGVVNDDEIIPAIQQLKAQLQQESANNSLLQGQLDELNEELLTAKSNNTTLTEKLQELMNLIGSEDTEGIKDKIIELQNKLTESETKRTELEQDKSDLISNLEEAEQLNHALQQRIDQLLALSGADVEELKRQILDLTDEINQMIQNNNELQESIDNLNAQVTEINTEKTTLESEIVRLETLLETANSTIDELRQELADLAAGKTGLENENAALKAEIVKLIKQLENSNHSGSGNSGSSNNSAEVKELQDKLDQALSDLENTKTELEKLQDDAGKTDENTDGNTDGTTDGNTDGDTGNTEIKIPENSVVVLPAESVDEPVIKESTDKPITEDKIVAEDGWEIAPTLDSDWAKEIDLVEVVGQTNKKENMDYSFYAREEDKPEQVYTQTVNVEKPVAIPNFTMDKLIYLGSEFNLIIANIPKDAMVTYKSTDSSIAKINKSGTIIPIKAGKTKIVGVVKKDGISYQFTVNVTVKDGENRTLNLKDQAVQTSSNNPVLLVYKLVNKDKNTKINLKGYANNATVSYVSSDSGIATVNKDGVIKGVKKGNTTITATLAQNNTIYTYIIKVRVDDGTEDDTMWDYLTTA